MRYVIGIDGGGTKTRGILMSINGQIILDLSVGPSNYQLIGITGATNALAELYQALTKQINTEAIAFVYFGLSGADLPSDFEVLNKMAKDISNETSFVVENDTWCVFRSALHQYWGAVSLYGTGSNAGAVGQDGAKHILRALGYAAGGYGGGDEMSMTALHYAFRSEEGTYLKSALEHRIPEILGVGSMSEVVDLVYPEFTISNTIYKQLPPLIFQVASEGDPVAIEILENFGRIQGEMVAGMIVKANLANQSVPVVIGGSVFKGSSPHFINAMMATIQRIAPLAYYVQPKLPPVAGSLLSAIEFTGTKITEEFYRQLETQFESDGTHKSVC